MRAPSLKKKNTPRISPQFQNNRAFLAFFLPLADLHDRLARHTDMLTQRHHVITDERNPLDCQIFSLLFVVRRMNPVVEVPPQ